MVKYFRLDKKTLTYKNNTKNIVLKFFASLLIGLVIGITMKVNSDIRTVVDATDDVIVVRYNQLKDNFTKDKFRTYLMDINIRYPYIAYSKCEIETGFDSNKFTKYNNLFSMRKAGARPTTAIGYDDGGFAIFRNWRESVLDYALYYSAFLNHLSEDEMIDFICRNYDPNNPLYKQRLMAAINKNKKLFYAK